MNWCPLERRRLKSKFLGSLKESKEISLLQSLQHCMMPSTWLVNWSSKQFRVGLLELVKAIKGNVKTTKETPTTITPTTTTTTTETTTITNKKIGGRKLPGPMQPQLRVWVMLGIYQGATVATLTTMDNALQSVEGAKVLVIRRKIAEIGFQQNPNVVTGTFLLNDHYACILFDSGSKKSFVSFTFTHFIDIAPTALNTSYEVELADGKVVSTNTILGGCTLALYNHYFKIDLLPTLLGSFNVIVGMDWLSYHRAVIDCYDKIVRIPLPNGEILEVQGERPEKDPGSHACIKAVEKKLDDIRITKPLTLLTQKNKTYVWGDKQDEAFHILKEKLCNAPVLALFDGPNDLVVYCDASKQGFGCVLMQRGKKELNMRQRWWIELLGDYECEIKYHPGKANVVADAFSRKERLKPRRVRAMSITIHSGLKTKILEAQGEASRISKP
ncbi:putative reverse transcriptase domain-containing protein [Tanacetum coccineum]|uniref:Reverse transcriptase domain-containing protein n=1 Tax=Tanacetum coccineum TaxID=301880 RepID=A0ABQ5I9C2_9ASTR